MVREYLTPWKKTMPGLIFNLKYQVFYLLVNNDDIVTYLYKNDKQYFLLPLVFIVLDITSS